MTEEQNPKLTDADRAFLQDLAIGYGIKFLRTEDSRWTFTVDHANPVPYPVSYETQDTVLTASMLVLNKARMLKLLPDAVLQKMHDTERRVSILHMKMEKLDAKP